MLIFIEWTLHFNIMCLYANHLNFGFKIIPPKDKKFCLRKSFLVKLIWQITKSSKTDIFSTAKALLNIVDTKENATVEPSTL